MAQVMKVSRVLAVTAVALGFCLSFSCGGGGGTIHSGLSATFTPLSSGPAGTITMQAGSASGDTFTIRIAVSSLSNFYGAAFHVIYNPASASYQSMDHSGSFLSGATAFEAALVNGVQGDLAVAATRIGNVPGVTANGDLIVLTFKATAVTNGNTFSFGGPPKACGPSVPACATPLTVSWFGGTLTAN